MTSTSKYMIFGSMGVAGLVAIACIVDLILGYPFAGNMVFDILFLIASGVVGYMAFETYKELS